MKKLLSLITVAGLVVVTAGCKLNMRSEAYVSDLRAVANGAAGITTPATLMAEIPSHDECDKYTAAFSQVMHGLMRDFSPKGCEQEGMNSYLLVEAQLPLVHSDETWKQADSLFGILTTSASAIEQGIGVALIMDLQKYNTLNTRMDDEFSQKIDLAASRLTMVLNNDERGAGEYLTQGVFVDESPVIEKQAFALKRRQQDEIRISNVGAAYLEQHGFAPILILKHAPAPEPK